MGLMWFYMGFIVLYAFFSVFHSFPLFLYGFIWALLLYGFDSNQMPQKMILHHHRISPLPFGGYTSTPFSVTTIFF